MSNQLVISAREWLGTKWQHNQCKKGLGVDCVNFLYAVAIESGLTIATIPKSYGRLAIGSEISDYLSRHFILKPNLTIEESNILLFQFSGYNNHVAIATGKDSMIHASASHKKVVEHTIDNRWLRILKGVWKIG